MPQIRDECVSVMVGEPKNTTLPPLCWINSAVMQYTPPPPRVGLTHSESVHASSFSSDPRGRGLLYIESEMCLYLIFTVGLPLL